MRQIGILGGTFDPIHKGHIALALNAKKKFELDEVWMMPSPNPPHKAEKKITDYRLRSEMLKIALRDYPSLQLSEFEIQRQGKIYTYETLQGLNAGFTDVEFSFIMGADSLFEIEKWVRPDIVMREARILVAFREYAMDEEGREATFSELKKQIEYLTAKYMARISIIRYNRMDISSGMIRDMVASGMDITEFVDKDVADYIARHNLYKV